MWEDENDRFRDDPEWEDVEPIPLNDEEQAAVKIATSDSFNDAFMYLRAVVQTNEMSERAFKLTNRCTELNPANYTLWQYRRALLKALDKNLDEEFTFIAEAIEENPKTYQVWHHRKILIEWTKDPSRELEFISGQLEDDSKNYHAWQLRQWVVDTFNMDPQKELDYSAGLLLEDVRNNSAWNYRYFILQSMDALKEEETLNREIAMTEAFIKKAPNNESAWNYLAGILLDKGISARADVVQFCERVLEKSRAPLCLSFLLDSLIEIIEKSPESKATVDRALKIAEELKEVDPVRRGYWDYQEKLLSNMLAAC